MDRFLPQNDELARLIDKQAAELLTRLKSIDAASLGMPDYCLQYFKSSHTTRLFFSIETSAHILYRSIRLSGKPVSELALMDYGAGVGTLFLLAKMIGCRMVIYNDHLNDWKESAALIAKALDIAIDIYIVGGIEECLQELERKNIRCDIVTSRNVIEHIYKLDEFYKKVKEKQSGALVFSSTTANNSNPASVMKHIRWHKRWEKIFVGKRLAIIQREIANKPAEELNRLAAATKGLAVQDLQNAIVLFRETGKIPDPSVHRSNTCDPENGVWFEHLLSMDQYRHLIGEDRYHVSFEAGFWDTHYKSSVMNIAARMLNTVIRRGGRMALRLAPFIYVIAKPR